MEAMCPPGYHHNGFVATHALGHMIYIVDNSITEVFEHLGCVSIYIYEFHRK